MFYVAHPLFLFCGQPSGMRRHTVDEIIPGIHEHSYRSENCEPLFPLVSTDGNIRPEG